MRKEVITTRCRAVGTDRDIHNSKCLRLLDEQRAEVKMRVPTHRHRFIHSGQYVFSDFVTFSGNRYAAMHYNIMRVNTRMSFQQFKSASNHPIGRSAPACMKERDCTLFWSGEVHRNAISDSYQHQCASRGGSVTIGSLVNCPTLVGRVVPEDVCPMDLVGQDRGGEFR